MAQSARWDYPLLNYSNTIPEKYLAKHNKRTAITKKQNVDLRTATLQFCAAPSIVTAVILGQVTSRSQRGFDESCYCEGILAGIENGKAYSCQYS